MKYENMIIKAGTQEHKHQMQAMGAGAYRVTITYTDELPDITYYYKSRRHRTDGPAYIDFAVGNIDFRVNGMFYRSTKHYCKAAGMSDEETFMWVLMVGDILPTTIEGFYGEDWRSIPVDHF